MKIFAISDMHSYLTPTLKALKDAGWDENNSDHIIVVCGDALDRGNETAEMVAWILDLISKGKLIYVKGNHDILMQKMLDRGYSEWHDKSNGTEKSYYQLLNAHADMMDGRKPDEIVRAVLKPLYDKMVNYFETKNYIFVHSWIPANLVGFDKYEFVKYWRNATDKEFENAMGIFYKLAQKYSDNHILLVNLARCEKECGKIEEAKEHLRQALLIFSDYSEALELLEELK